MSDLTDDHIKILRVLQKDASLSNRDIARRVGLSENATFRRLRYLKEKGFILGYRVTLDHAKLGAPDRAFVRLKLGVHGDGAREAFEQALHAREFRSVLEVCSVRGGADYVLTIVARDGADFEMTLSKIESLPHVSHVETAYLRSVCKESPLPLPFKDE